MYVYVEPTMYIIVSRSHDGNITEWVWFHVHVH